MSEARRQRISQHMTRIVGLIQSASKHFEEVERELEKERIALTKELQRIGKALEQERKARTIKD